METYNKLSEKYDKCLFDNVQKFSENVLNYYPDNTKDYCLFYPQFGYKEQRKGTFLFYGQAVNGWPAAFSVNNSTNEFKKLIDHSLFYSNHHHSKHSPLDWVKIRWCKSYFNSCEKEIQDYYKHSTYYAYRSFFWNVVYKVICDHCKFENGRKSIEWTSKMVWSNLYKIAPSEGANPDGTEQAFQQKGALELFQIELEELKPDYCIFLTNYHWAKPFLNSLLSLKSLPNTNENIEYCGIYNDIKMVVAKRPRYGNSDKYAKEILSTISL